MGGSAQESRQLECTPVEMIWQTRSFRCDTEPCRKCLIVIPKRLERFLVDRISGHFHAAPDVPGRDQ